MSLSCGKAGQKDTAYLNGIKKELINLSFWWQNLHQYHKSQSTHPVFWAVPRGGRQWERSVAAPELVYLETARFCLVWRAGSDEDTAPVSEQQVSDMAVIPHKTPLNAAQRSTHTRRPSGVTSVAPIGNTTAATKRVNTTENIRGTWKHTIMKYTRYLV